MNRKSFLKALVGGTAAAVVLPSALSSCEPVPVDPKRIIAIDASRIPQGVSIEDTAKEWNRSGELRFEWSVYQFNSRGEPLVNHNPIFKAYNRGIGLDELLTSIS